MGRRPPGLSRGLSLRHESASRGEKAAEEGGSRPPPALSEPEARTPGGGPGDRPTACRGLPGGTGRGGGGIARSRQGSWFRKGGDGPRGVAHAARGEAEAASV